MAIPKDNAGTGFTLIEVIVIITLGALIASMMVPFVSTALTRSGEAVNQMADNLYVGQVMEKVLAAYRSQHEAGTLTLATFKSGLAGYAENGVSVTGAYISFRTAANALTDTNSDGVYDPSAQGDVDQNLLLVAAAKNDQSMTMILGAD